MTSVCPACTGTRASRHYLCSACWGSLSATARRQLSRRDPYARERLRQLYDALHDGVPLPLIVIEEEAAPGVPGAPDGFNADVTKTPQEGEQS